MQLTYTEIDRDATPLGTLSLHRYVAETGEHGYEIRIDDRFLMATHGEHGETVMARLAHARLTRPPAGLAALVGGLGAGHTLRACLDLPGVTGATVAEISGKVVEWNRRHFAASNGDAVGDPRVEIRVADLAAVLAASPGAFDLALLDVDNGPGWLAADGNAALYTPAGLERCRAALKPGGVLAVWSPTHNAEFLVALRGAFKQVEAVASAQAEGRAGQTDVVYLGF